MPITAEPFGLPRPIDPANFFASTKERWLGNQFWMPEGPLAGFRERVFDPYAQQVADALRTRVPGLRVRSTARPHRYIFMVRFTPLDLRKLADLTPTPPVVTLQEVIRELQGMQETANPEEMLDLLSIIREDLPPRAFKRLQAEFPWIESYLH